MPAASRSRRKAEVSEDDVPETSATEERQQTGSQRQVMQFMPGKISSCKYEQRVDNCTKDQLSQLLTSPEFQQWQSGKQPAQTHFQKLSKVLIGLLLLTTVPFLFLALQFLTHAPQQVTIAELVQAADHGLNLVLDQALPETSFCCRFHKQAHSPQSINRATLPKFKALLTACMHQT